MIGLLIIVVVLAVYTYWDNNRITIARQEITIDDLPEQFEGFEILQITDLHEKVFGKNQKSLIDAINSINYDAIVFTGDMLDGVESTNYKYFYTLIDGINNKEHAWYVPGNADPESYQVNQTVEKSEFIQGMEKRGVTFLENFDTISVDGKSLRFVNFELSIGNVGIPNGIPKPSYAANRQYLSYQKELMQELKNIEEADTLIALNHYPVVDPRIDHILDSPNLEMPDYDLLMAGHYHGGQIRLPLIGALFVPEAWYDNGGFFPPQDRVKGLWEYKVLKQYVSTGLGSSDAISFLKFRLFNPPQINVLSLKRGN
ncbi:metallophosphoesterase [Virgibacillus phasianinus]|uniref:metallophosphoesterase n=1 Tax=Virgibacillus phasianinus TaxID=2017483 RepID=UPI0012FD5F0A|nr:metallophosphoesterase [Virgibacillus phasianinus]